MSEEGCEEWNVRGARRVAKSTSILCRGRAHAKHTFLRRREFQVAEIRARGVANEKARGEK